MPMTGQNARRPHQNGGAQAGDIIAAATSPVPAQGAGLLDRLTRSLEAIAVVVLAIMALHIVLDVALTALFARPLTGTLEIVGHYYMVSIILLPLAALHAADRQITAEFFTAGASRFLRRGMDVAANLCLAGYSVLIVWQSAITAWQRTQETENIMVSQVFLYVWPSRWLVPFGFGLLALVALVKAAAAMKRPPDFDTAYE
jgi:TRAP-type C4-dicarboxylate transport system permease small subunit